MSIDPLVVHSSRAAGDGPTDDRSIAAANETSFQQRREAFHHMEVTRELLDASGSLAQPPD